MTDEKLNKDTNYFKIIEHTYIYILNTLMLK